MTSARTIERRQQQIYYQEWLTTEDWRWLSAMLPDYEPVRSLLACTYLRHGWSQLGKQARLSIEIVEQRFLRGGRNRIWEAQNFPLFSRYDGLIPLTRAVKHLILNTSAGLSHAALLTVVNMTRDMQLSVRLDTALRDLVRNPFRRPPRLDPAWLRWNNGVVVRLLDAAEENRIMPANVYDNVRLAILADALEEASCTDQELLGHLRNEARHCYGCWAIRHLRKRQRTK